MDPKSKIRAGQPWAWPGDPACGSGAGTVPWIAGSSPAMTI